MMKDWILKRNDSSETLELHSQFVWADEYDWTALVQSEPEYSITGAMDVQQGTMLAGRPISLNGDVARINRGDIAIIREWSTVPELEMTLTHPNGDEYQVMFSRPFISNPVPIYNYKPADQSPQDPFKANVYFITV